jgi:hypothetical protein
MPGFFIALLSDFSEAPAIEANIIRILSGGRSMKHF